MIESWMLEKASKETTTTLKDWIWEAVQLGQPVPGNLSVDSLRMVLIKRGHSGRGYHDT